MNSAHVQSEVDKASSFIERIQHIRQQVHDILDRANAKYKQRHDQHRVPHNFQVGDKVWLHLQKERLTGPHRKLRPLRYGPYTITKAVGNNAFELSIPPFLGLHPVFNVDRLRPYFPPLLDTSDIAEQLTPTELNPDCMEQATTDCIMDMQIKNTRQQKYPTIQVDIGGHPPIPLGAPPLSLSFFQFPAHLLFLAVFRVLNFRSRFEALNDVFWENV